MIATEDKNILYGGLIPNPVTNYAKSAGEFFLDRFQELGEKTVLVEGLTGIETSARCIKESAVRFAKCLQCLGVKEGAVVGICSENRREFAYAMYGTVLLNATFAPYNLTYSERELDHMINLTHPKVIFASEAVVKKITKVAHKKYFVKHVISFDDSATARGIIPYTKFLNLQKPEQQVKKFKAKPTEKNETVLLLLCSSGTTGLPKAVQLTQKNILCTIETYWNQTLNVILSVIPWSHTYGCMTLFQCTLLGSKLVYWPRFEERNFLGSIQRYKVEGCLMVPSLMVFLAKHPIVDQFDLSSLKVLFCGTAPLSKEMEEAVKRRIRLPLLQVRQGYGMTETTRGIIGHHSGHAKPGSIGTLRFGTYAKVVDTETGKTLGPNQIGEFCFKGDMIMKGYLADKESTDQVFDSEGWLHTGDIGYYDDDFEFFYVDRMKEVIKYKGFQVPPAEIEALLLTHPKIRDAAVIGIPDQMAGELPMAFVVKQPNEELGEKEVADFVAESVSSAKRLRGGVRFVDEIPKTALGKLQRRVLKELIAKEKKSKL